MSSEDELKYRPLIEPMADAPPEGAEPHPLDSPDRRDGAIYDWDAELHLAVEVALAAGRPLLLRGEPGSGKSSLAAYVARNLGWRYYEHTVTSSTRARDFLWRFDAVRRLADAQARAGQTGAVPLNDLDYVEPGVLWWVFNPESARQRGGLEKGSEPADEARDPNEELNDSRGSGAVVLIDEIDKADPEVPNALLVPLGSNTFRVADLGVDVARVSRPKAEAPEDRDQVTGSDHGEVRQASLKGETSGERMSRLLVVVTTNEERQLPPAFVRRCVAYQLKVPDVARLVRIAELHFGRSGSPLNGEQRQLCRAVARRVWELRGEAEELALRPPSTAEFLDAVRVCLSLDIGPSRKGGEAAWEALEKVALRKAEVAGDEDFEEDEDLEVDEDEDLEIDEEFDQTPDEDPGGDEWGYGDGGEEPEEPDS